MKHVLKLLCAVVLLAACSEQMENGTFEAADADWPYEPLAVSLADDAKVAAANCDEGKKVLVCHVPPGNPDNRHTICISENAVDTHLDHHKDYLGDCATPPPTPTPAPGASPTPMPSPDPTSMPSPAPSASPMPSPTPDPDVGGGGNF